MQKHTKKGKKTKVGTGSDFGSDFTYESRNQDFGYRIKKMREKLGLRQEDLARISGVSKTTIQSYEAGKLPRGKHLKALVKTLGCSADYLLFGERTVCRDLEEKYGLQDEFVLIPMVGIELSAGNGSFVTSDEKISYFAFRKDWIKRMATAKDNLVLMTVQGFSMAPYIKDGDVVMIDQGRKNIYDGYIYAIRIDQTVFIKELRRLSTGEVKIISYNKDEFPPETRPINEVVILGQIIWLAKELIRAW